MTPSLDQFLRDEFAHHVVTGVVPAIKAHATLRTPASLAVIEKGSIPVDQMPGTEELMRSIRAFYEKQGYTLFAIGQYNKLLLDCRNEKIAVQITTTPTAINYIVTDRRPH